MYKIQFKFIQTGPLQYFFGLNRLFVGSNEAHKNLSSPPNFLINGASYTIPMAIEESSVVAAACKAAKFWRKRGGFKTKIIDFKKTGQVHFIFNNCRQDMCDFCMECTLAILLFAMLGATACAQMEKLIISHCCLNQRISFR